MIGQFRSLLILGHTFLTLLILMLSFGYIAAVDDNEKKEDEALREEQLKTMKRSAAQYAVSRADDQKQALKLNENSVMRFSNPVGGTKDGTIFLWTDHGCPRAVIKLFTSDDKIFSHEWQSLADYPLVSERDGNVIWSPSEPGITFRELADAPMPAESAAERLRQMKSLAGKFSSSYTAKHLDLKPVELRLLAQPLFRYEANKETKCLDGAMFGFAQATTPMGLLLFEVRQSGESHRYHYAFSRITSGAMTAKYGDKEIYSVERYDFKRDPKQTFLQLQKQPIPKE